jgi:signal transduction histidine kinase
MVKNLRLKTKIFVFVSTAVIVSFLMLTGIVSNKTFEMAKRDAFNLAQETADNYNNQIKAELQGVRVTSETLATVFETLKDHGLTDRTMMNDILRNTLAKKEYITAFCIAYDPDALDGKDARFAGQKPAYDETGRYAPYWNKLGDNIAVEPLYDIDIADWYIVPKETLQEYITDPYPYEVQGNSVMLASMIFPIIHKGGFIGIISSDFVLDTLQEMISKVNPHGQEGYTEIFSNAGAIVAHPDKPYLGKELEEALVYEMLLSDHSKLTRAINRANEYLADNPLQDRADEDRVKAYEAATQFVDNVKAYAVDFDATRLDLSSLNPELARAMLKADPARLQYATEAKEAIRNGTMYISSREDFYTVYIPIQFSSVTKPWSVAVGIPMIKILDNADGIRNYVVLASIVAICVIACILYIIAENVTKPILTLSHTAKILGEGNFTVQVPLIQSNDEIGALSGAFKFMAEKINTLIGEMQQYARALEEKNVYLNKLNALKDEFLANTSHELRTPINGIIGIVESMIDGATGALTDEQKYNLAIVSNSGKRLSNMINDILDFTKLKNKEIVLQIKPVDLKTIVDMVMILSKPLVKGKELALVNEIDGSLAAVDADENRLQQILYNLIGNAIKFTDKGKITVSAEVSDGSAAIAVTDTGIGIPEDKFDRIFETFEQADGSTAREYGGTGLGLSITKKIVELHGGTIRVASRPGEGAVFTFTLPVSGVKSEETAVNAKPKAIIDMEDFSGRDNTAQHGPDSAYTGEAGRILVVDDEPVNIQVLKNFLYVRNYSVSTAYNGRDALARMENGENFDLILLDVMMPKMSGYEVCRKIRERYSLFDLPVLMLTAKNRIQDMIEGFQSGANDYIQKPFDKDELLARIQTLLELKSAVAASLVAGKARRAFLANMSHEIRTPLNAVIGLTHLMLNTPMDDRQRDYTEKMQRAAATLLGIVNDILDFSKVEDGKLTLELTPFDIRRFFDDTAVFFREQSVASGIALRFDMDPALPGAVLGDPLRLNQIFINLVNNAFKFTERGAITVSAAVSRIDGREVTLEFAVQDTGIGMSREQMSAVFEAFTQADNSFTRKYGGTGLGLAITRQMVELMGGKISVSGEEGKGTVFSFSCPFSLVEAPCAPETARDKLMPGSPSDEAPCAPETASGEEVAGEDDTGGVLRGMRVLLVEDNEINTMIAEELLSSFDIEVTTAENGQQALAKLAEAFQAGVRPPFDLVLMDLQMPVMDGYAASKSILENPEYRDLPIFAMTAHAFDEEKERCLAMGMKGHLSKPIDVEELRRALLEAAALRKRA